MVKKDRPEFMSVHIQMMHDIFVDASERDRKAGRSFKKEDAELVLHGFKLLDEFMLRLRVIAHSLEDIAKRSGK